MNQAERKQSIQTAVLGKNCNSKLKTRDLSWSLLKRVSPKKFLNPHGKRAGTDGVRTRDLRFTRPTPYHLATAPDSRAAGGSSQWRGGGAGGEADKPRPSLRPRPRAKPAHRAALTDGSRPPSARRQLSGQCCGRAEALRTRESFGGRGAILSPPRSGLTQPGEASELCVRPGMSVRAGNQLVDGGDPARRGGPGE